MIDQLIKAILINKIKSLLPKDLSKRTLPASIKFMLGFKDFLLYDLIA